MRTEIKRLNYKSVCYLSTTDSGMDLSIHSTVMDISEPWLGLRFYLAKTPFR